MNDESPKRATFTRMDEGTPEDWKIIGKAFHDYADGLVDRVIAHLRLLDGDFGGFNCDRLTHSLQTATRAFNDGKDGIPKKLKRPFIGSKNIPGPVPPYHLSPYSSKHGRITKRSAGAWCQMP